MINHFGFHRFEEALDYCVGPIQAKNLTIILPTTGKIAWLFKRLVQKIVQKNFNKELLKLAEVPA